MFLEEPAWSGHSRIGVISVFDDAGLMAVGSSWIDDQIGHGFKRLGVAQPTQSVDKADAVRTDALSARGLQHDHVDQVIDQTIDRQFLAHTLDGSALELPHFQRGLELGKVGLDGPANAVKCGDLFFGITYRIQQRRGDGNAAAALTVGRQVVAQLPHP